MEIKIDEMNTWSSGGTITINEVIEPGLEIMAAKNTLPLLPFCHFLCLPLMRLVMLMMVQVITTVIMVCIGALDEMRQL